MKLTLAASLFCFLLACGCDQAQQPQVKPVIYSLRFLTVSGTYPKQTLWLVDGGDPNEAYQTLQDAALLRWVSNLPKGSEIDYRSPWASVPFLAGLSAPDAKAEGQLKAFDIYCHSKGILFCDRFPVL